MTLRIEVVHGDITRQQVDAIVNAANSNLLGGGGVDGAIHRAAGPSLLAECRRIREAQWPDGLPTGAAVATSAGNLPARWVIHTVGPRHWEHADGGVDLLASCHTASLDVAAAVGARSVAFPAISCGVFGWQAVDAAPTAISAVRAWAAATDSADTAVELVRFVLVADDVHAAFAEALSR